MLTVDSEQVLDHGAGDACGCPDDPAGGSPTRRSVLAALGLGAGAAVFAGPLSTRFAFAAGPSTADVVVVVFLRGGFDALSAVMPISGGDEVLLSDPTTGYRKTIGVRPTAALPLANSMFGMHPAMGPMRDLYNAGTLAVVHAAGSPDPTRSHFDAEVRLERAAFGTATGTGWLNRYLSAANAKDTYSGVELGRSNLPASMVGSSRTLSMNSVKDFKLQGANDTFTTAIKGLHAASTRRTSVDAGITLAALQTASDLTKTPYAPQNGASYTTSGLARKLQDVALLIKTPTGLRVASFDVGGWDMHENLGVLGDTNGSMHRQLTDLARNFQAFATDLGPARMNGVTLVTMSEFGRRLNQNDSIGLDHGHGGAMFVLGGGVRGGKVYGQWPGLDRASLDNGDLRVTTDYRHVLAEILSDRCGVPASAVFPNFTASPLDVLRPR